MPKVYYTDKGSCGYMLSIEFGDTLWSTVDVSDSTFLAIKNLGTMYVDSLDEVRLLNPREKPTLKLRRSPMPFTAIQNTSNVSFATMSTKDLVDLIHTATSELSKRF